MRPVMGESDPNDQLFTTEVAAAFFQIPASQISKWRHRRQVTAYALVRPRNGKGPHVPLYRLVQLEELAEAYKKRQAKRRDRLLTT